MAIPNYKSIGIVRSPLAHDKSFKVHCPFCDFTMELRKRETSTGTGALFGIGAGTWEHADNAKAGGGDYGKDWEALFEQHIRSHSVASMLKKMHDLEAQSMSLVRTAEYLNEFVDELADAYAKNRRLTVSDFLGRMRDGDLPSQFDGVLEDAL